MLDRAILISGAFSFVSLRQCAPSFADRSRKRAPAHRFSPPQFCGRSGGHGAFRPCPGHPATQSSSLPTSASLRIGIASAMRSATAL